MPKTTPSLLLIIIITSSLVFSAYYYVDSGAANSEKFWTVDDSGDADFTNIQTAIDNAAIGDTIYVKNGTYPETLTITKTINLVGEDSQNTLIDARNYNLTSMVAISANNVNFSGFRIGGLHNIAFELRCNGSIISGCNIDAYSPTTWVGGWVMATGFWLAPQTYNNVIKNNTIVNIFHGISAVAADCSGNIIDGNNIFMGKEGGVGINIQGNSGDNVTNNIIEAPNKAGYGVGASYCNLNCFARNIITGDYGYGAQFLLRNSFNNTILENIFSANSSYGVDITDSGNNTVYHNNFLEGDLICSTYLTKQNFLDNGYPCGGNYWARYTGQDNFSGQWQNITGSDGIGDTVFDIGLIDHYPLMTSTTNITIPPIPYQTPGPLPTVRPTTQPTPIPTISSTSSSSTSTTHSTTSPTKTPSTPTPTMIPTPTAIPAVTSTPTSSSAPNGNGFSLPDLSVVIIVIAGVLLVGAVVFTIKLTQKRQSLKFIRGRWAGIEPKPTFGW